MAPMRGHTTSCATFVKVIIAKTKCQRYAHLASGFGEGRKAPYSIGAS
jgi:hypothetical protein